METFPRSCISKPEFPGYLLRRSMSGWTVAHHPVGFSRSRWLAQLHVFISTFWVVKLKHFILLAWPCLVVDRVVEFGVLLNRNSCNSCLCLVGTLLGTDDDFKPDPNRFPGSPSGASINFALLALAGDPPYIGCVLPRLNHQRTSRGCFYLLSFLFVAEHVNNFVDLSACGLYWLSVAVFLCHCGHPGAIHGECGFLVLEGFFHWSVQTTSSVSLWRICCLKTIYFCELSLELFGWTYARRLIACGWSRLIGGT